MVAKETAWNLEQGRELWAQVWMTETNITDCMGVELTSQEAEAVVCDMYSKQSQSWDFGFREGFMDHLLILYVNSLPSLRQQKREKAQNRGNQQYEQLLANHKESQLTLSLALKS